MSRWWFQLFFVFTPKIGRRFPLTSIFFWWVVQPPTRDDFQQRGDETARNTDETQLHPRRSTAKQPTAITCFKRKIHLNHPPPWGHGFQPLTFPGCFWLFEICRQYTQMTYVVGASPKTWSNLDQLQFYAITSRNKKNPCLFGVSDMVN